LAIWSNPKRYCVNTVHHVKSKYIKWTSLNLQLYHSLGTVLLKKCLVKSYTQRSKEGCKVGAAVFENNFTSSMRLPDNASIFTAEA
jgi:hypothetical protein